jgi:DHA1 family bicyclomycin/chloramphenicol resistance-like MFS transporter
LSYIASSQAIFQDIYQLGDRFTFYFAALAFGIGCASLANTKLVMKFGAEALTVLGLYGLIFFSALLILISTFYQGVPPLLYFMTLGFAMFFSTGILFGNVNALAMIPLGNMAGVGAAVIGSISTIISVIIAVIVGWFYNDTLFPILIGMCLCAVTSLGLVLLVRNQPDTIL